MKRLDSGIESAYCTIVYLRLDHSIVNNWLQSSAQVFTDLRYTPGRGAMSVWSTL